MTTSSRRTVLTAALAAAAGTTGLTAGPAAASVPAPSGTTTPTYSSHIYRNSQYTEGTDYGRRFKRHERSDPTFAGEVRLPGTAVLALHGGGIETGTSEVALGIAGYHPKDLAPTGAAGDPRHDYWLFEGLRGSGQNAELHVTSTGCDDLHALGLAEGSLGVVSVHGFANSQVPGFDLVMGGLDQEFKALIRAQLELLATTGPNPWDISIIDGSQVPALGGTDPANPCNRTLRKKGVQLELSGALRNSLFDDPSSRTGRANTTNAKFWAFTGAVRAAIAAHEASLTVD
ncbi:poly-gamma-glutamate hydrolase family protein [Streptomyces qinzhouensis]|uniref:Phage replication protein n=1 Tax=Streptomyces qinzhouensis TaxID=2599401 RepID=A0A5B8JFH9_9ACTN|nr:poly-gamma-glutamate hydrolase family protein [Streptomyces qinzhouensis]QDY76203.1 phage replication protein [Streptomyces qinzhouensis]